MNRSERWRAASSAGDRRAPGPGGGAPKRGEAGRRWGEPSARRAQSPAGSPALGPAARRSHAGGRHAPDSAGEGGGGRLPPLRPPAPLQRPRTCPPPPPPPRCRHGAGGPHAGAAAAPSLARSLVRSLAPSFPPSAVPVPECGRRRDTGGGPGGAGGGRGRGVPPRLAGQRRGGTERSGAESPGTAPRHRAPPARPGPRPPPGPAAAPRAPRAPPIVAPGRRRRLIGWRGPAATPPPPADWMGAGGTLRGRGDEWGERPRPAGDVTGAGCIRASPGATRPRGGTRPFTTGRAPGPPRPRPRGAVGETPSEPRPPPLGPAPHGDTPPPHSPRPPPTFGGDPDPGPDPDPRPLGACPVRSPPGPSAG
ncbi:basic proline-rich protein-like [Aphelocoma coerulescens]|uniref:basic proline-rich protein-like n=1 Tax=Aphelocoma coerulescens TaxID=39617 RepID=UPI003604AD34